MLRRGSVARFSLGRLMATAGLLLALSFVVFGLLYIMPGDPAQNLLGVRSASQEVLAQVRAQYHLDEPFLAQYLQWLGSVLHGDFGLSIRSNESVLSVLGSRVVLTLQLVVYAFIITVVIAVPLGVLSALRSGGALDRSASTGAIVGVGAPSYAVGLLLLYVFGVKFGLLPVYGSGDSGFDRLTHLTLPAVTLAIGLGALVLKLTRTAVLAELDQDYVTFARSRGLPSRMIQSMVLRNAMLPVITSLGLVLTFLFGGTILVEITFALQGIGSLLAGSVTFKDIPVVQAITLLTAAVIALIALAVDLLYFAADPRVRRRAAA